ncbi:putative metalloprotease [Alkalihalophilus pseudofirmus OF4]|uniref:Endoribonuclease YbeY n=2 Tax=Alkalihalophilus pseudofirmus TaxID=79885 RepID=D3FY25_ALKPO|nr:MULTISPECIES: rRNA maturation RNase YbeY [Alkalihalophilus]ADC50784.1 putative metalloprotease [Alkalihalophilus pseudofirmus OF4]MDV2883982.1 rRNA maturation RNase YbeY [Alkalihalophilus pseudofirmus]MED1602469.1 rRNA maturation RNase YbeY [Alkalihalophilus marmarensis]
MNLTIDLHDETGTLNSEQENIVTKLITSAAEYERLDGEVELSITFVDEKRIQEINAEYRGKDIPTDVISFALNDEVEDEADMIMAGMPNALGDIIISVAHISRQAEEYGHSFERELGFLVVHGFLHLLGYDHMTEQDEKAMFSRQEEILSAYGLTR